jgi:hypothetical protein
MMIARLSPIFSAAFAIAYVIIEQNNLALFTYHPRINEWGWLMEPSRNGPGMYWYGWIGTSFVVASLATLIAFPVVRQRQVPSWIGWAVPIVIMVLFVYLLRAFFFR